MSGDEERSIPKNGIFKASLGFSKSLQPLLWFEDTTKTIRGLHIIKAAFRIRTLSSIVTLETALGPLKCSLAAKGALSLGEGNRS